MIPQQVQLIGKEIAAVGNYGSDGDLYFGIVHRSLESARGHDRRRRATRH